MKRLREEGYQGGKLIPRAGGCPQWRSVAAPSAALVAWAAVAGVPAVAVALGAEEASGHHLGAAVTASAAVQGLGQDQGRERGRVAQGAG